MVIQSTKFACRTIGTGLERSRVAITSQESSSRWTDAVLKLTKLTREGRITWTRGTPQPKKPTDMSVSFVTEEIFVAEYDNQRLRFRRRFNTLNLLVTRGDAYTYRSEER